MNTLQSLQQLISEHYGIATDTLQPDAPLSDYGLDSLALAELLFTIEEHFDIDFPADLAEIKTLAGLSDAVDRLRIPHAA